jgi:transcriptional regulator GlxA family with amidase domain
MKISIVAFDDFTDIDVWFMWDLLNRVERPDWRVQIVGERCCVTSSTGIRTQTHARLDEANTSDVVLFASGKGTRVKMRDDVFLDAFNLDPERQLIGSMCSGALILAALGLLEGKRATTYPTSKRLLEEMGVTVVEAPFVCEGNVATAAGCLAAQYLVGWVIEESLGKAVSDAALKFVQPVGEGLSFDVSDYEQALALLQGTPQTFAAEVAGGRLN